MFTVKFFKENKTTYHVVACEEYKVIKDDCVGYATVTCVTGGHSTSYGVNDLTSEGYHYCFIENSFGKTIDRISFDKNKVA